MTRLSLEEREPESVSVVDRSTDTLVRLPEVLRRTGLSRATIYRKIERDEFPAGVRLSANAVAWYESDINRWVADPAGWAAIAA